MILHTCTMICLDKLEKECEHIAYNDIHLGKVNTHSPVEKLILVMSLLVKESKINTSTHLDHAHNIP